MEEKIKINNDQQNEKTQALLWRTVVVVEVRGCTVGGYHVLQCYLHTLWFFICPRRHVANGTHGNDARGTVKTTPFNAIPPRVLQ